MDSSHIPWIADTGAAQDLMSSSEVQPEDIYESSSPLKFSTANGCIYGTKQADVMISQTDSVVKPYVLGETPSVLSVGMRCLKDGYDFVWRAYSRPYFRLPDGRRIKLEVKDNVPFICPPVMRATPAVSQNIPRVTTLPSAPIEVEDEVLVIDEEPETLGEQVMAEDEAGDLLDDGDELGNDDFLLDVPSHPPEGEVQEELPDMSHEEAPKVVATDFVSKPVVKDAPRERGEAALRDEATSLQHLMCHTPKNPFCETCNRAKMYKYPSRQRGGSTQVEAKKFGDHLTADHLITSDDREVGIDHSRVALVIRDVATDFRYVYPAARKTSHQCVMAFKHFIQTGESVNIFYSDNAPELVKAADQMEWKHVQSTNYISRTNSIAERNVRSIIEGTRTNLEQAGLHHSYWPLAAKHYCMARNITDHPDYYSPWKVRFGEDFPGPYLPFGCQINYWTGPKTRPNKPLKFEPTARAGIFLGYPIHPDFLWRHEFLVVPLRDLMDKDYDAPIAPMRVNQIKCPTGEFIFPMVDRHLMHMNGVMPGLEYAPETPDPAAQDAPLQEDDLPAEMPGQEEEDMDDLELAKNLEKLIEDTSVKEPASDDMVKVIDLKTSKGTLIPKEGGAHYDAGGVKARRYSGSSKPDSIPPFLWKTMSLKQRRQAIVKEDREKARAAFPDEPVSEHPEASSSRARPATSAVQGLEDEFMNIPLMPTVPFGGNHSSTKDLEDPSDVVLKPAVPSVPNFGQHRCKILQAHLHPVIHALVARPVGRKEIESNPDAQKSIDKEWHTLENKGAWDYKTVREWSQVTKDAKNKGEKVHVGKIIESCVEKGSELQKDNPLRKFKGRTVFQGNNVKDENAEQALFAELGSAPSTMEAAKAIDAYGAMPGNCTQQSDGRQAYTQALYKGIKTWVRLPKYRWPKGWAKMFSDPVVQLILALYGHPDSGGLWEKHCEDILLSLRFRLIFPGAWPSVYWHPKLRLLLAVYVDDFKMSGPVENMAKGWSLISSKIDMDPPTPVGRYLGCEHLVTEKVKLSPKHHPFAHVFDHDIEDPSDKPAAAARRTQDFWEHYPEQGVVVCQHEQPRRKFRSTPSGVAKEIGLGGVRYTECNPCLDKDGIAQQYWHFDDEDEQIQSVPFLWVGTTYFFHENVGNARLAAATVKKLRDKTSAKKANRAKGFSYIDELFQHQPCMDKPVTVVTYDMTGFLQQCLDRYIELAGGNIQFKKVSTPFQDDRIARPTKDDTESKGVLQPIASKILMKVLFAARMARFDLLRATQGLASRVTKWSVDCDQALFRLMCYIHTTVDRKMHGFVGDPSSQTRLWLFADSDHAGEHDSRSTSGCFLALIGPNTFYPLTAFSKKQTSTAMSSIEAEVIAANVALRAVGLPSSCLWEVIQSAGGGQDNPTCAITPSKTSDYWLHDITQGYIARVHNKKRNQLYVPSNDDCPVRTEALSSMRYTVLLLEDGSVDLDISKIGTDQKKNSSWTGKTYFFMRGAGEIH